MTLRLTIEVASLDSLARILDKLARVRAVIGAARHIE